MNIDSMKISNPNIFSAVLDAEIISRETSQIHTAKINQIINIIALTILFEF